MRILFKKKNCNGVKIFFWENFYSFHFFVELRTRRTPNFCFDLTFFFISNFVFEAKRKHASHVLYKPISFIICCCSFNSRVIIICLQDENVYLTAIKMKYYVLNNIMIFTLLFINLFLVFFKNVLMKSCL